MLRISQQIHSEPAVSLIEGTTASAYTSPVAYTAPESPAVVVVVYELSERPLAGSVRFLSDPDEPAGLEEWNLPEDDS